MKAHSNPMPNMAFPQTNQHNPDNGEILGFDQVISCKAPATCGEFVQGYIGDRAFLINCPVDLYARATVKRVEQPGLRVENPERHLRIQKALGWMQNAQTDELGLEVSISDDIPRDRGMGETSAEINAAISAVSIAMGQKLKWMDFPGVIAHFKPEDNSHLSGISETTIQTSKLVMSLPAPTNLRVIIVDCGDAIDTVSTDPEKTRTLYLKEQANLVSAVSLMRNGLRRNDLWAISDAATASAIISQRVHPKPFFNDLLTTSLEAGALGINCAHAGNICGILYCSCDYIGPILSNLIKSHFGDSVKIIGDQRIISGGCSNSLGNTIKEF